MRDARGFTFVEMLIVVAIIGILATIALPSFQHAVTKAKEAALKENLFILRDVIDQHYADLERYPPTLAELVEKRYLRRVPADPITGRADSWTFVHATDEQGQENGIVDVRSGSEQVGLNGVPYREW
ncbi:MAG: prepilin-type N-terminal cleavage/methylation domain-containing protein [candidate division NC10 bacterium]|nr:prepilin-type N-terminal cleavage/methylation domain-containing protein [candidate division NC10 bacterium]